MASRNQSASQATTKAGKTDDTTAKKPVARVKLISEAEIATMDVDGLMALIPLDGRFPLKVTNNSHRNANRAWEEMQRRAGQFLLLQKKSKEDSRLIGALSEVVAERDQLLGRLKGIRLDFDGTVRQLSELQAERKQLISALQTYQTAEEANKRDARLTPFVIQMLLDLCSMVSSHTDVNFISFRREASMQTAAVPMLTVTVGAFTIVIEAQRLTLQAPSLKIGKHSFTMTSAYGMDLTSYLAVQGLLSHDRTIKLSVEDRKPSRLQLALAGNRSTDNAGTANPPALLIARRLGAAALHEATHITHAEPTPMADSLPPHHRSNAGTKHIQHG